MLRVLPVPRPDSCNVLQPHQNSELDKQEVMNGWMDPKNKIKCKKAEAVPFSLQPNK